MKAIFQIILAAVILGGCGGGNSDKAAPVTTTSPLSGYVGTWLSECNLHERETAVITEANGALILSTKTEYFELSDCTGAVLATMTLGADFTISYENSKEANVILPPSTVSSLIKVDQTSTSIPQYSSTLTGPGVTSTIVDGVTQQCFTYGDEELICSGDDADSAQTIPLGLYIQGDNLFLLAPSDDTFTVNRKFVKK